MGRNIMNRRTVWTALLAGSLIFCPSLSRAQHSQVSTLKAYTLSGGGVSAASTSYNLNATLGQSSPAGISSSASYVNHVGLWYTVSLKMMLFLPLILKE
jgi:hypothetical protein